MDRIIKLTYQDHNSGAVTLAEAHEPPSCLCSIIGEVVYEDRDWIRICHEHIDIGGEVEEYSVTAIRKADVTRLQELISIGF